MKLGKVAFLWNVGNAAQSASFNQKQCATVSPSERIDCGYEGIMVERCISRNCCWDETSGGGVPWCFQTLDTMQKNDARLLLPVTPTCNGDPSKRKDCGWGRINESQCQELGCCFDDTVKGVPWCSYKLPGDSAKRNFNFVQKLEDKYCTKPSVINTYGYEYSCTDGFRLNSVCSLRCENRLSGEGKTYSITCDGGKWIDEEKIPSCDAVWRIPSTNEQSQMRFSDRLKLQKIIFHKVVTAGKCHAPITPENASRKCTKVNSVIPNSGIGYQYICTYACYEGYQMIGSPQRSCPSAFGNSAHWTGETPKCVIFDGFTNQRSGKSQTTCLGLRNTEKQALNIDCGPGTKYGQMQCKLSCPPQLRLVGGPNYMECPYNKKINLPPRPVCIQGYCDKLSPLINGGISCTEKELNGSKCTFSCNPGFNLVGSETTICSGISWSAKTPICVSEKLHSVGECKTPQYPSTRLLNGQKATEGEFQAVITYQGKFRCSGVIIDSNWVLTAAHCVKGLTRFIKVYHQVQNVDNLESAVEVEIDHVKAHENWDRRSQFDIALIKLKDSVSHELAICLPKSNSDLPLDTEVRAYGFGFTSPEGTHLSSSLLMGRLDYIPPSYCGFIKKRFNYENLFCGRGQSDTCDGDSGGPVVYKEDERYVLVGIVSSGECGGRNPGIYVRVSKFVEWIQNYIYEQT